MLIATISNEETNELPTCQFDGEVIVVDTPEMMRVAEKILKNKKALGIDTETRPAFSKGVQYEMALLQVSTEKCALLFRLQKTPLSKNIVNILANPDIIKIGAALKDDLRGLQKSIGKFTPKGFIDLQNIIEQWGVQEKSVRKMSAIVIGAKVSKAQRLSNWEATNLTHGQQIYAAIDAWVCLEIYQKLQQLPKIPKTKKPQIKQL